MVRGARAIRWVLQRLVIDRVVHRGVLRRHRRAGVADVAPPRRPAGAGHRGHGGRPVRRDPVARPGGTAAGRRQPVGAATRHRPWWSRDRRRRVTSYTEAHASAVWLESHGVPRRCHHRGRRGRLVDQPVAGGGGPAPAGPHQGPHRDRRLPRGPEPRHRLQRRAAGVAGRRPPTPRSRGGRPSRTTPRRRWGWPWAGSSGTRASTGWASLRSHPFGGGVIGNTAGSGPVIGGSSPPPRANFPLRAPLRWGSGAFGVLPARRVPALRTSRPLARTP